MINIAHILIINYYSLLLFYFFYGCLLFNKILLILLKQKTKNIQLILYNYWKFSRIKQKKKIKNKGFHALHAKKINK